MSVIAVYNIKGGVGKTATAINLAYVVSCTGSPTLICDLDPQGSTSFYLRVKPKTKSGADGLIKGGKKLGKNIKATDYDNLDVLPSDFSYRNLDIIIDKQKRPTWQLKGTMDAFRKDYEYIFVDCPPNITIVSENIFNAADYVLVPVIPTTLSVRTFFQLSSFFKKYDYRKKKLIPFFSMVERRKKLHREVMEELTREHKNVLKTTIPYSTHIERMGVYREPLPAYAPGATVSKVYKKLWREFSDVVKQ